MHPRTLAASLLAVFATGCADPPPPEPPEPAAPAPKVSSGTDLETFFPLVDRHVYRYGVETDRGDGGMLIMRARRRGPKRGALVTGGEPQRFRYASDGVVLEQAGGPPVYVLKSPLEVGQEWRGEHGGTVSVVATDTTVRVPAGRFTGCVETVEQRGGDRPLRVATTFCPEVGIVELEATGGGGQLERATLESYGPPMDLGPDGVKVIPPGQ